jgi:hypothetical protein
MPTMKKGTPKLSPFAQMLRDKREKLAPSATLREFCAARGLEAPVIDGMEHDRRTAPGTYGGLYKLASGYGHGPTDRWTVQLLEAALGKAPVHPKPARPTSSGRRGASTGMASRGASTAAAPARRRALATAPSRPAPSRSKTR